MIRSGKERKARRLERKISIYENELRKCEDFLEFLFYHRQVPNRDKDKNRTEERKNALEIILSELKERFRLSCLYQDTGSKGTEQAEVPVTGR